MRDIIVRKVFIKELTRRRRIVSSLRHRVLYICFIDGFIELTPTWAS